MKRISFFKKLKLFFLYKKIIKENRKSLEKEVNLRIDDAYRMYTVLNIPEDVIGESYILKKSDRDIISQTYVREYISVIYNYLDKINLRELYSTYDVKKVEKNSYLIIIGYSLFKSNDMYNKLYHRVLPLLALSIILFLSYMFFG